jgi:ADP-ribose pyrophosphatase YjhB (NUDIX family)
MADRRPAHHRLVPSWLYRRIVAAMPIACVDLMVVDAEGRLLLLKRGDEPAKGHWWFPGGRVHLGEARAESVPRKLREECSLCSRGCAVTELATEDVILPDRHGGLRHGVTTVFRVQMPAPAPQVRHDEHSEAAEWRTPAAWLNEALHPFVHRLIATQT